MFTLLTPALTASVMVGEDQAQRRRRPRGHQSPHDPCLPFHKPPSSHREARGLEFKLKDPISMLTSVQWQWRLPMMVFG